MNQALAPVVQMLDSTIHRIKIYLVDNAIGFPNTNQLDSDLSSGQHYPTFEQLKPALLMLLLSFFLSFFLFWRRTFCILIMKDIVVFLMMFLCD